MGNQIVSPSMGNWYNAFLKRFNISLKGMIESGTFLLTMDCVDESHSPMIVKAYEYCSPLEDLTIVSNCIVYLKQLNMSDTLSKGIVSYTHHYLSGNYAFLVRDKLEYTLSQRMQEYPPLEDIEKQWIAYRVLISVMALHELELVHGAINPDNIFVTLGLDVCIGDVAPFKPSHIRSDMPHLFYHYFATAGRSYCYMAPEQLLSQTDQMNALLYQRGTYSMDLFSVGCVLYYLYTGKHLLTFSDVVSLRDGTLSLEDKLEQLPLYIRPLVNSLLARKPEKRRAALGMLNRFFPLSFGQISNQFFEFFHGEVGLDHLLRLVPAFEVIVESPPDDLRLLFVNAFCQFLIRGNHVQEITAFARFLVNFASSLGDTVKLNRVLPYFCALLNYESDLLKSVGLRCINDLIKSIDCLPTGFEALFSAYLIPMIVRSGIDASSQYKSTMAVVCPDLAYEINRLAPDLMNEATKMFSFVIQERDSAILTGFIHGMKTIALYGCKKAIDDRIVKTHGRATSQRQTKETKGECVFPAVVLERRASNVELSSSDDVENVEIDGESEQTEINSTKLVPLRKCPSDSEMNDPFIGARIVKTRSKSCVGAEEKTESKTKQATRPEIHCSFSCFIHYFPLMMSALNSSDVSFRANVLSILKLFYDNSKLCDRRAYRKLFLDVSPTVLGFISGEKSDVMLSNFLGFLLWGMHHRLLSSAHIPDVTFIVSGLRQASDVSVRYFAEEILKLIPKQMDIESIPSFVIQVMTRVTRQKERPLVKRTESYGLSCSLMTRKKFSIEPQFYASQRVTHKQITFLSPHHHKDLIGVIADSDGCIYSVKKDVIEKAVGGLRPITAVCEMRFSHGTAITDIGNRIIFIDWEKQKPLATRVRFDSKIVSMVSKGYNYLYCLSEKGTLHFFDSRLCKSVDTISFDKNLTGLSLCAWNDCITLGIGFEQSIVQLLDTRMMLPVKAIVTERPNQIFPVARNACNFIIATNNSVLCYDAFLGDLEMIMTIPDPVITEYDGGIVSVNRDRASFTDCEHFETSIALYDQQQYTSMEISQQSPWIMDHPVYSGSSLHKHVSRITTLTHSGDIFLSGDDTGFVNFWSVGKLPSP